MKLKLRVHHCAAVLLFGLLVACPVPRLHAQQQPASTSQAAPAPLQNGKSAEVDSEDQQYTHSTVVRKIASLLHLRVDTAAAIFEDINSALILLAIAWLLFKFVPGLLRRRSVVLQKSLAEARTATEDANRRLAQVESRLQRLDSEIEAIRRQVESESAEDERRILAGMEAERARIVASAEQEIGAAQAAAQRELKQFAADLAIDQARHRIQVSSEADRALIRDFGKGLNKPGGDA